MGETHLSLEHAVASHQRLAPVGAGLHPILQPLSDATPLPAAAVLESGGH